MSTGEDTRKIADRRRKILAQWFEDLKTSGDWKRFVTTKGKLKVSAARRMLGVIEGGEGAEAWSDDYFKQAHWSQVMRSGTDGEGGFEGWVRKQLSTRIDRDLFGNQTKESLDLPIWLEDEDISPEVLALIEDLAGKAKRYRKDAEMWEHRYNKRGDKILELDTQIRNMPERNLTIDQHCMGSTRTLRFNADRDMDLSQESLLDLFGIGE